MIFFGFAFSQDVSYNRLNTEGTWLQPNSNITADYFQEHKLDILGLLEKNQLQVIEVLNDEIGMTHTKYQQHYMGFPIEGAIVILHEKAGYITTINGHWVKDFEGSYTSTVSFIKALQKAKQEVPAKNYYWEIPEMESKLKEIHNDVNATYYPENELV